MSFHELYLTINQRLDQLEQSLTNASTVHLSNYLEELEAFLDYQESILENWLYVDKRLQNLHVQLQQKINGESITPSEGADFGAALPFFTLASTVGDFGAEEQDLDTHYRRGLGFFDLNMFRDSAREFEKILQLQPNLLFIRFFYAISLLADGNREFAERELQHLLASTDDPLLMAAAWEAQAQLYVDAGKFPLAIAMLRRVLEQKPDNLDAHVNLALCAFALKDYPVAKTHALWAIKLDPQDALYWRMLGAANYALNNLEEAYAAYRQALLKNPAHPTLLLETAHLLQTQQRYLEAGELYRTLIDHHELVVDALMGLAESQLLVGHFDQATSYLKKRLALVRNDPRALLWYGYALYGQQEYEQSRQIFLKLVELPPPISLLAATGLARVALETQDIRAAKRHLRLLATQTEPKWRAYGFSEYGYLYAKTGQRTRAMRFLERALAIDPAQTDASIMLAQLQIE